MTLGEARPFRSSLLSATRHAIVAIESRTQSLLYRRPDKAPILGQSHAKESLERRRNVSLFVAVAAGTGSEGRESDGSFIIGTPRHISAQRPERLVSAS